jgi:hypothetical protein
MLFRWEFYYYAFSWTSINAEEQKVDEKSNFMYLMFREHGTYLNPSGCSLSLAENGEESSLKHP